MALFYELGLPSPWTKHIEPCGYPLIVNGASTAIGAYAIKLASLTGIHPIIAVGSSTSDFLKKYLDSNQGDVLVDYTQHKTPESLCAAIKEAAKKSGVPDGRAFYAFDTISENGSPDKLLVPAIAGPPHELTGQKPRLTVVLNSVDLDTLDESVEASLTYVPSVHGEKFGLTNLGTAFCSFFARGLHEGWFEPHPHEVISGGLDGLAEGLKRLRDGKVRGKKLVGRPGDTQGAQGK